MLQAFLFFLRLYYSLFCAIFSIFRRKQRLRNTHFAGPIAFMRYKYRQIRRNSMRTNTLLICSYKYARLMCVVLCSLQPGSMYVKGTAQARSMYLNSTATEGIYVPQDYRQGWIHVHANYRQIKAS